MYMVVHNKTSRNLCVDFINVVTVHTSVNVFFTLNVLMYLVYKFTAHNIPLSITVCNIHSIFTYYVYNTTSHRIAAVHIIR